MGRLGPETTEATHGTMTVATCDDESNRNHSQTYSPAKATVVRLALWGLLPVKAAHRIVRQGGLRDA